MRTSIYVVLFAGSVAAQSSVTLLQIFSFEGDTLTQIGSDATATTYKNNCTAGGISVVPSSLRPTPDSPSATITPAPTPRARVVRQASASSSSDDGDDNEEAGYTFCEPYTLKQGSSTWEFSFTDPLPGAWAASMNCKWQGAITDADLTCTMSQTGYVPDASERGVSSTVYGKEDISSMEIIGPVAVVTASATSSGLGGSAASGSPGAAKSTGRAPGGPAPTAMAFVGGAVGILAAALAL